MPDFVRDEEFMSEPPGMFSRPTDPPAPLEPLRAAGPVVEMHAEWARMHKISSENTTFAHRLRDKAISLRSRIGGPDRQYLGYVVRAVDDVAARCDELAQRLNDVAISLDDLARTLGEDVTRLRAELESASRREPEIPRSSPP
jgi:hypothetical protein